MVEGRGGRVLRIRYPIAGPPASLSGGNWPGRSTSIASSLHSRTTAGQQKNSLPVQYNQVVPPIMHRLIAQPMGRRAPSTGDIPARGPIVSAP